MAKSEPAGVTIWVIYDHPSDYPDYYVARKWVGDVATSDIIVSEWLEQLRMAMKRRYLRCLARHNSDDEVIVETWL
jgi:hypothetical protein